MALHNEALVDRNWELQEAEQRARSLFESQGDLIVLRSQRVAESGEMVAAWLPERSETTLKYFYREGRNVRLQPANPAYAPLIFPAEEVEIQGKVIAIIRQLD